MSCSITDCSAPVKYGGMCGKHYKRWWRHGDPSVVVHSMEQLKTCSVAECNSKPKANNLCDKHYQRMRLTGKLELSRNENGMGGVNSAGYRVLGIKNERVYEHILIAEKALGKPLPPKAVVHHISGIPDDNYGWMKLVICPDQAYHLLVHRLMREKSISFRDGWPNGPVGSKPTEPEPLPNLF